MARAPSALWREEDYIDLTDSGTLKRFLLKLNGFAKEVEALASRQITFGENLAAQWKEVTYTAPGWIAPTLLNSWVNYGAPYAALGYCRDGSAVHLRGLGKSGTVGSPIFTLPVGYRPPATQQFEIASGVAPAAGTLEVRSNGDVALIAGSNVNASLDGISFLSAEAPPANVSIQFKHDLPGGLRPKSVTVERASLIGSDRSETQVSLPAVVGWTESNGQVTVTSLSGLAPSAKYRILFLVKGG